MAHPDPHRSGSERDQRRHVGKTGEASDAGMKDKSQSKPGTHAHERETDDLHFAEAMPAGSRRGR